MFVNFLVPLPALYKTKRNVTPVKGTKTFFDTIAILSRIAIIID